MDEVRLRNLLQENILRVEKENWDSISKEIQEKSVKKSEQIPLKAQSFMVTKKSSRTKNGIIQRKVKPLNSIANSSSIVNLPNKPTTNCFLTTKSIIQPEKELTETKHSTLSTELNERQHSITFLNDFESRLREFEQSIQQWRLPKRRFPKSIPLSQPIQKNVHFNVEKLHKSNKENNHLYHIVHRENGQKLAIQKLPSVTIYNKNCKANSNVSLEEIKEYDDEHECKIISLNDDSTEISHPPCSTTILSHGSINKRTRPPEISFTANRGNSQSQLDKNKLKALLREVIEESVSNGQIILESNKDGECLPKTKPHRISHRESITKERQLCRCQLNTRNTLHTQTERAATFSNFCQTDTNDTCPDESKEGRESLRNLIKEVMSECHAFSSIVDAKNGQRESGSSFGLPEVDNKHPNLESNTAKSYLSKEIQVLISEENEYQQSNLVQSAQDFSRCGKAHDNKAESESLNHSIEQQLAAVTSKVDNLLNVFNNHVAKNSDLCSENIAPNNSSHQAWMINTRDVSLQYSPCLIDKCSNTSPVRTLEKANQCEDYLSQTNKQYSNASTQAALNLPHSARKKSATVSTQSECLASVTKDSWVQTEDMRASAVECSNNSSVAASPISDSPFLDDILSEGEIPLHLKFLSYHNQTANRNSAVADSSEEIDYSLSEGEIHPRYLQSLNDLTSATNRQSKGVQQCASLKALSNKNASVGEVSSFLRDQHARQINSSTPIPSTSPFSYENSPGEVLFQYSSTNQKPISNKNRQLNLESVNEINTDGYYRYRTGYRGPDKFPSPSNLSSMSSLDNSN